MRLNPFLNQSIGSEADELRQFVEIPYSTDLHSQTFSIEVWANLEGTLLDVVEDQPLVTNANTGESMGFLIAARTPLQEENGNYRSCNKK